MAILRRVPSNTPLRSNVRAIHDVPGHEAGRFLHAGDCPLRGQAQVGGMLGPLCSPSCHGPTPSILVESTHAGLVLVFDETAKLATVWNFLTKQPEEIPLPDDPAFPAHAEVDATQGVVRLHGEWMAWRGLEEEARDHAKRRSVEERERRKKEAEDKAEAERVALAEAEAAAEAAKQRRIASAIRPGRRVRFVADPPGFTERNKGLKPRNRTPSAVDLEALCTDDGYGPFIFVRLDDGTSRRVLRNIVRVVLSDGTLGDADERVLPREPTP